LKVGFDKPIVNSVLLIDQRIQI